MKTRRMEKIVNRLRTVLWPVAIYRFDFPDTGPAPGNRQGLNLCVIVADDNENAFHKELKARSSLRDLPSTTNLVVRHEREFQKRAQWLDSLEHKIKATGELLYGRADDGPFIRTLAAKREPAMTYAPNP